MPIISQYSVSEKTYVEKKANFKKRDVSVFIQKEGEPTSFFCMYCKNWIMDHHYNFVMVAPGEPPQELKNITVRCSNPRCNTFYHFTSAV